MPKSAKSKDNKAEQYDVLVETFRSVGRPDFAEVALLSGVPAATVKEAWNKGLGLSKGGPLPPIRDLFLSEKTRARATRAKLHAKLMDRSIKATEQAHEDNALSAALEGLVARSALMAADELVNQVRTLSASMRPLVESLARDLYGMSEDKDVSTAMKLSYVTNVTKVFKDAMDAIERAQKIEGKFLGRPDVKIEVNGADDSIDDAVRAIMNGYVALANAKGLPNPEGPIIDVQPIEVSQKR